MPISGYGVATLIFLAMAVVAVGLSTAFAFWPRRASTTSPTVKSSSSRSSNEQPKKQEQTKQTLDIESAIHMRKSMNMSRSQYEQFRKKKRPAIVAFVSDQCGYCKAMLPQFQAAAKFATLPFIELRDHEAQELLRVYKVSGFPTILYLGPNGERVREYQGDRSMESLAAFGSS